MPRLRILQVGLGFGPTFDSGSLTGLVWSASVQTVEDLEEEGDETTMASFLSQWGKTRLKLSKETWTVEGGGAGEKEGDRPIWSLPHRYDLEQIWSDSIPTARPIL